jgi:hypothetical protein
MEEPAPTATPRPTATPTSTVTPGLHVTATLRGTLLTVTGRNMRPRQVVTISISLQEDGTDERLLGVAVVGRRGTFTYQAILREAPAQVLYVIVASPEQRAIVPVRVIPPAQKTKGMR